MDTVTIVDVTNKMNPNMLARLAYAGYGYTHQGWLDEEHDYFVFGDELDEPNAFSTTMRTKTLVLEVKNLTNPILVGSHMAPNTRAIDHNQYIIGQYTYQANYRAGLRILRINDLATAKFTEVGYFDIYPQDDEARFNGAWGVYPFFPSGSILVSGIEQGLYVLKTGKLQPTTTVSSACNAKSTCSRPFDFLLGLIFGRPLRYTIHRYGGLFNRCIIRCVSEFSIEKRIDQGWICGGCV
jgi:hypothetical protein